MVLKLFCLYFRYWMQGSFATPKKEAKRITLCVNFCFLQSICCFPVLFLTSSSSSGYWFRSVARLFFLFACVHYSTLVQLETIIFAVCLYTQSKQQGDDEKIIRRPGLSTETYTNVSRNAGWLYLFNREPGLSHFSKCRSLTGFPVNSAIFTHCHKLCKSHNYCHH